MLLPLPAATSRNADPFHAHVSPVYTLLPESTLAEPVGAPLASSIAASMALMTAAEKATDALAPGPSVRPTCRKPLSACGSADGEGVATDEDVIVAVSVGVRVEVIVMVIVIVIDEEAVVDGLAVLLLVDVIVDDVLQRRGGNGDGRGGVCSAVPGR